MCDSDGVNGKNSLTVWARLQEYAATHSGPFTSQDVLAWFRGYALSQVNDRTLRTHIRGACWNVGDRSQFSGKEPFLTRIDRGLFRVATEGEVDSWRANRSIEGSKNARARLSGSLDQESARSTSGETSFRMDSVIATPSADEWHSEANVQALLVTALATDGWRIISVANTATKEHGIDVIATKNGMTSGIEVKGFPSRVYADPARAGEPKRTRPSTQAVHWYSQAVLAAMRLRGREPAWQSVIALPDFPRYRSLHSETSESLAAAAIEVWWVGEDGEVSRT
nr:hypothetical protein [Nocardioides ochotonae]